MNVPGRNVGIALSILGFITFPFPLLSLPMSLTALFQLVSARKAARSMAAVKDKKLEIAYFLAVFAISASGISMIVGTLARLS
jgi:hypothetical protein